MSARQELVRENLKSDDNNIPLVARLMQSLCGKQASLQMMLDHHLARPWPILNQRKSLRLVLY